MTTKQKQVIMLVACIAVALGAEAGGFPEPWRHIFTALGAVGTAVTLFFMRPPGTQAMPPVPPKVTARSRSVRKP